MHATWLSLRIMTLKGSQEEESISSDSIYVELETANEPVLADQLRLGMERGILGGGLLWCLRR